MMNLGVKNITALQKIAGDYQGYIEEDDGSQFKVIYSTFKLGYDSIQGKFTNIQNNTLNYKALTLDMLKSMQEELKELETKLRQSTQELKESVHTHQGEIRLLIIEQRQKIDLRSLSKEIERQKRRPNHNPEIDKLETSFKEFFKDCSDLLV